MSSVDNAQNKVSEEERIMAQAFTTPQCTKVAHRVARPMQSTYLPNDSSCNVGDCSTANPKWLTACGPR